MDYDKEYLVDTLLASGGGRDKFLFSLGCIIGEAVDFVQSGAETFAELEGCEKAYLGVKIEKMAIRQFGLPSKRSSPKPKLDTRLAGVDVDIKCTIGKNWMIPPEAVGEHCLLIQSDLPAQKYNVGLIHATPDNLTTGLNQDKKASISRHGRANIVWIANQQPIHSPQPTACTCGAARHG